MPILAVYIIPNEHDILYRAGSSFLGYDIRAERKCAPMLADTLDPVDIESWLGMAPTFGMHATIGDALDYAEETIPEIILRLEWIASRIPPFTLVNGRFREFVDYSPETLAATFDSPDGAVNRLHYLVTTMINVLYRSSPYYRPRSDQYAPKDKLAYVRYGVPGFRLLDRFNLHFSFATRLPDRQTWEQVHDLTRQRTGLFSRPAHQALMIDSMYLLEQQADRYFRITATFPLIGQPGS